MMKVAQVLGFSFQPDLPQMIDKANALMGMRSPAGSTIPQQVGALLRDLGVDEDTLTFWTPE
jgi:hypothetical protein